MEKLQTDYVYAVGHDATIPSRYPELTLFLKAKQTQARHGAQTRRAKKKATAKAAKASAQRRVSL